MPTGVKTHIQKRRKMNYHNSMEGYYYWEGVQGYSEQMYRQATAVSQVTSSQQATMTGHFDEDIFQLLDDQDLSFLSTCYDDNATNERYISISSNDAFNDDKSTSNVDTTSPADWDPSSVDEIVTQLSQYHGSPETSDLEMRSVESFVDSPTDQNQVPSILGSTEDDRKVEEDNDPSKCSVCKEAAGKHSYYGGRVCPSCRAFFRRAVQSKYFEIFFCSRGGEQCDITLNTRRSCQYCRFKKCLEAGMRIAWVLPDGERQRRFDKFQKSTVHNKFSKFLPKTEVKAVVPIVKEPSFRLTIDEKETLKMMNIKFGCLNKDGHIFALSHGDPYHFYHIIKTCYSDYTIPYESWMYMTEKCTEYTKQSLMEDMKELPEEDRNLLLENNAHIMFTYKTAAQLGEEGQGIASILNEARMSGNHPLIEKVIADSNLDPSHPKNLNYNQVFVSPWAETFELEQRHKFLFDKMKQWSLATNEHPRLRLDETLVHLMRFIIAFNSDFLPLSRKDLCDQFILNHTMLLRRYLKEFYPKTGMQKFAEAFTIISYAREANQIYKKRLSV